MGGCSTQEAWLERTLETAFPCLPPVYRPAAPPGTAFWGAKSAQTALPARFPAPRTLRKANRPVPICCIARNTLVHNALYNEPPPSVREEVQASFFQNPAVSAVYDRFGRVPAPVVTGAATDTPSAGHVSELTGHGGLPYAGPVMIAGIVILVGPPRGRSRGSRFPKQRTDCPHDREEIL